MTEAKEKSSLKNSFENALRRKRKHSQISGADKAQTSAEVVLIEKEKASSATPVAKDEDELRKKAAEILVREAQRSAQRADRMGPQGWLKPRPLNTNKNFLTRTLQSVEISRRDNPESKNKKTPK